MKASQIFQEAMKSISSINEEDMLALLRNYLKSVDKNWNYVTPEELHSKKSHDYFLLDIRDEETFKKSHIKGAINIFWLDLLDEKNLKKLPKDKTICCICYVGHTASQILVILSLLGYDVKVLKFGMGISPVQGVPVAGWLNFGFEIEET